jgi:YHS domain-containing protein/thiol-disulfide isomerase/thioredoxin
MTAVRCIAWGVLVLALAPVSTRAQDQIAWQPSLEVARKLAAQTNRLVLVHFWSTNCKPCVRLEKEVLTRPEVARALSANFVMVKLNVDESLGTARVYGVSSVPADVVISPSGQLVSQQLSPPTANQYVAQLTRVAAGYRDLIGQGSRQAAAGPPTVPTSSPAFQTPVQGISPPMAQVVVQPPSPPPATTSPNPSPLNSSVPAAQQGETGPASDTHVASQGTSAAAASQSIYENDRYAEYYRRKNLIPPGSSAQPPVETGAPSAAIETSAPLQSVGAGSADVVSQPPVADPTRQPMPNQAPAAPPAVIVTARNDPSPPAEVAASPVAPLQTTAPAGAVAAAPSQPVATQATGPQVPPGSPPVALDGFCSVTLVERRAWAAGNVAHGVVHRGRTYLFVGPEQAQKFLANPEAYAPVLSGNDPVLALDNQVTAPGRREYGVFSGSRIYLFANEESRSRFQQNPNRYAAEVVQAMR